MASGLSAVPAQPKEMTLTERLNLSAKQIDSSCDRLEMVLCRVNNTPGSNSATKDVTGNLGLADVVVRYESISQRISALADGVERIA